MAQGDPIVADLRPPCLSLCGPFRCNCFTTRIGGLGVRGRPPPIESQQQEKRDDQPGNRDSRVHEGVDMTLEVA